MVPLQQSRSKAIANLLTICIPSFHIGVDLSDKELKKMFVDLLSLSVIK